MYHAVPFFMSDILLCVECSPPSLSRKFFFIFQNQLKHNFLHETFPDVTLSVFENTVFILLHLSYYNLIAVMCLTPIQDRE